MSEEFTVKEILKELMKETKEQSKALTNIDSHLAKLNSKVASHELYLANLDTRVVEERKHREEIKEDIAGFKGATRVAVGAWATLSSIIVGVITHHMTK